MTRQRVLPILLASAVLFGPGCVEKTTPTEVPAFVSPTPTPTPVPQPAILSGKVTTYGGPLAGAQGRSRRCRADPVRASSHRHRHRDG